MVFDTEMFEKYQILTSKEIQKNFFRVISRRKSFEMEHPEYLLIAIPEKRTNWGNVCKNGEIAYKNLKRSKKKYRTTVISIIVSVVIFIAMVLMVTYQVIARYFFKSPSSVTEVLTRYCFVWLIIISATYMFGQREHINISVIKDKLPKTPKMIVSIIIELVTICFAGLVMVYGGFTIAKMNLVQLDTILHIPTGVIYSIIPICGVIIIFYSIYNIGLELKANKQ